MIARRSRRSLWNRLFCCFCFGGQIVWGRELIEDRKILFFSLPHILFIVAVEVSAVVVVVALCIIFNRRLHSWRQCLRYLDQSWFVAFAVLDSSVFAVCWASRRFLFRAWLMRLSLANVIVMLAWSSGGVAVFVTSAITAGINEGLM
jgi:hypothetical protein